MSLGLPSEAGSSVSVRDWLVRWLACVCVCVRICNQFAVVSDVMGMVVTVVTDMGLLDRGFTTRTGPALQQQEKGPSTQAL